MTSPVADKLERSLKKNSVVALYNVQEAFRNQREFRVLYFIAWQVVAVYVSHCDTFHFQKHFRVTECWQSDCVDHWSGSVVQPVSDRFKYAGFVGLVTNKIDYHSDQIFFLAVQFLKYFVQKTNDGVALLLKVFFVQHIAELIQWCLSTRKCVVTTSNAMSMIKGHGPVPVIWRPGVTFR